ncbi:GTP pyrophosphokinase YjbM [Clostridium ragsdalei P11]|uniref:GTP pyrophosphokinase YjbM n=1 Tax=Clostridium ragsdalei P11 TaxID=1353534 RepID=A0A1A6B310_9CLOT|nr:hypothetical protein [Clostridium ragsdalei]OBR96724.1 GTP pyrophosphokinase YjbM [Clostridium ragsdalei P11]
MEYLKSEKIKKLYISKSKNYKKLGFNLVQALKILLDEAGISYLTVCYRIKDTNSFIEKIERKNYLKPFEQIEDICGIRVICYYKSDIDKICQIINKEFKVLESQDKEELLKPDQFGYRSYHFIVKIKDEWLCTPNYKGLGDLKAEIQVRTNLMHTWAEIEHKLEYKKEEDIPKEFKRKFSFLSAKLEEADEQFESLKDDITDYRNKYKEKILDAEKNNIDLSESSDEVNLDNLQAFLDCYFSDRKGNVRGVSVTVSELNRYKINIPMLTKFYNKYKDTIFEIERNLFTSGRRIIFLTQVGALRILLMLADNEYFKDTKYFLYYKNEISKYKK